MKRSLIVRLTVIMTAILLAAACMAAAADEPVPGSVEKSWDHIISMLSGDDQKIRIVTGPFCENVNDVPGALEAAERVVESLGGDETTMLVLDSIRTASNGLSFYHFRQVSGDLDVYASSVKIVVDGNGKAVCAVGSLTPNLELVNPITDFTAEQAEQVVMDHMQQTGAKVIPGTTRQTVLPMPRLASGFSAWVVITDNPKPEPGLDLGYIAHYVNEAGEYLGCHLVSSPDVSGVMDGSDSEGVFLGCEARTWTQEVTLFDGRTKEVTVPVMVDKDGDILLGDVERKIVCADYGSFKYQDRLFVRIPVDGRFDDGELLAYDSFIKVWNLYDSIGWTGPDGEGTPALLLMDWVTPDGTPVINACYRGKNSGYQTFAFNRVERDGECIDLVGHEFTHAVTQTLLYHAPYLNDMGAINEALSDIMGNLIESLLDETDDTEWLIGEGSRDPGMVIRCMSDPHRFQQPAFVWDRYYAPNVDHSTDANDNGGVHTNSSLLNWIAWRLHAAGMDETDEMFFFLNVTMAMTGGTDYPQMAELLPWMLMETGYEKYMDVLTEAVEETGIGSVEPQWIPAGCATLEGMIPGDLSIKGDALRLSFMRLDSQENEYYSFAPDSRLRAVIAVVLAGTYSVALAELDPDENPVRIWHLVNGKWADMDVQEMMQLPAEEWTFTAEAGGQYTIPVGNLAEILAE